MTDVELLASILQGEAPDLPHLLMLAGTMCLELNSGQSVARIVAEYPNRSAPGPVARQLAEWIAAYRAPAAKG
jgi:hypothetical protein